MQLPDNSICAAPKSFMGNCFSLFCVCISDCTNDFICIGWNNRKFFRRFEKWIYFRWIIEVWELYAETIYLSLLIAIFCLIINLFIGVPAAYSLARIGGRTARVIEEMIVLPVAIPGLAIALALIIMYGGFRDFRTSWAFILVGHVLYTLPFMVRSVLAVLTSTNFKILEKGCKPRSAFLASICQCCIAQCQVRDIGWLINGNYSIGWRIQSYLDAPYTNDKDITSWLGR